LADKTAAFEKAKYALDLFDLRYEKKDAEWKQQRW
jgi:hypothetical protein